MKKLRKLDARKIGVRAGGLAVLALVIVLVANALDEGEGGSSELLSEAGLLEAVADVEQTVYWVGPYPGTAGYKLDVEKDGTVALHYVAKGAEADEGQSDALLVAGYPVPGASEALLDALHSGEGLALTEYGNYEVLSGSPENAYVVYSTAPDLQIEIFSPEPGEAERLAKAGVLTPLE